MKMELVCERMTLELEFECHETSAVCGLVATFCDIAAGHAGDGQGADCADNRPGMNLWGGVTPDQKNYNAAQRVACQTNGGASGVRACVTTVYGADGTRREGA